METKEFEIKKLNSLMDAINEVIYVADPQSYEILYLNQHTKSIFRGCYRTEVLSGLARP